MTGGQPGINGCLATDATPAPHARRRTERVVEGERSSGTALSRNLLVGVNGEKTPPGGCQGSAASLRATSGACRIGDVSSPTPRGRPQAADGRGQRADVRGQRADVHRQWADVHGQRADVHGQWAVGRVRQVSATAKGLGRSASRRTSSRDRPPDEYADTRAAEESRRRSQSDAGPSQLRDVPFRQVLMARVRGLKTPSGRHPHWPRCAE